MTTLIFVLSGCYLVLAAELQIKLQVCGRIVFGKMFVLEKAEVNWQVVRT
jgi:hypothetical protein